MCSPDPPYPSERASLPALNPDRLRGSPASAHRPICAPVRTNPLPPEYPWSPPRGGLSGFRRFTVSQTSDSALLSAVPEQDLAEALAFRVSWWAGASLTAFFSAAATENPGPSDPERSSDNKCAGKARSSGLTCLSVGRDVLNVARLRGPAMLHAPVESNTIAPVASPKTAVESATRNQSYPHVPPDKEIP